MNILIAKENIVSTTERKDASLASNAYICLYVRPHGRWEI